MQFVVITVAGEMDQMLRDEFDEFELVAAHGVTQIRFIGDDAAALHGVLHRVEALGMELLGVRPGVHDGSP